MNREAIEKLLQRQPFEPFEVQVSSGTVFQVRHPEMVVLGKSKLFIYDTTSDMMDIVALLHITNIRTLQAA